MTERHTIYYTQCGCVCRTNNPPSRHHRRRHSTQLPRSLRLSNRHASKTHPPNIHTQPSHPLSNTPSNTHPHPPSNIIPANTNPPHTTPLTPSNTTHSYPLSPPLSLEQALPFIAVWHAIIPGIRVALRSLHEVNTTQLAPSIHSSRTFQHSPSIWHQFNTLSILPLTTSLTPLTTHPLTPPLSPPPFSYFC